MKDPIDQAVNKIVFPSLINYVNNKYPLFSVTNCVFRSICVFRSTIRYIPRFIHLNLKF